MKIAIKEQAMPHRLLALAAILILSLAWIPARAENNPCPPAGTTFPREPVRIKVEQASTLHIELSQLPEVRLIGVLDNHERSKQIPLVWDPLESPRLSYNIPISKGWWTLSFRSDPLYRTSESIAGKSDSQRVSLSYKAVSELPPIDPKYSRCLLSMNASYNLDKLDFKKDISDGSDCKNITEKPVFWGYQNCIYKNFSSPPRVSSSLAYEDNTNQGDQQYGWTEKAYIRLHPFNLFERSIATEDEARLGNRKHDIIVQVFSKDTILNKERLDEIDKKIAEYNKQITNNKEQTTRLWGEIGSVEVVGRALTQPEVKKLDELKNTVARSEAEIRDLQATIAGLESQKKKIANLLNTVAVAVAKLEVSESRQISGRSLSDPVPQAIADLFSILAEIAFDRAKAKSFSLLSERATKLVCADLTGALIHKEIRDLIKEQNKREKNLADPDVAARGLLWWIGNNERPLLPHTCETIRNLRIQELATSGRSLFDSLTKDIAAVPQSLLDRLPELLYNIVDDQLRLAKSDLDLLAPDVSEKDSSPAAQAFREITKNINLIRCHTESLFLHESSNKDPFPECSKISDRDPITNLDSISNIANVTRLLKENLNSINKYKKMNQHWDKEGFVKLLTDIEPIASKTISTVFVVRPLAKSLLASVHRYANGGGGFDERDIQSAFVTFAKEFTKQTDTLLPSRIPAAGVCPVRFALAVMAECQLRGGCDAATISQYIQEPAAKLFDEYCRDVDPKSWSAITTFISRGLEVVRATKTTSPEAQLRNVVELIFDATEFVLAKQQMQVFPFDLDSWSALRSVSVGAIEHDPQKLLVGFARLINLGIAQAKLSGKSTEFGKALQKFSALAGAVASYTQSYPAGGETLDEKQAKAQREARKRAIESMMDLTTNRTARAGDFIVSMGIHPGFNLVGGQLGMGTTGQSNLFYTQLTLPTGIALQWLAPRPCKSLGWHLQFSLLDLAQFVSFDGNTNLSMNNLRWADFVMAGIQGGMLLGSSPNAQFFIGADLRYSPTLSFQPKLPEDTAPAAISEQDSHRGVFRAGLTVGYYVPFFDFN